MALCGELESCRKKSHKFILRFYSGRFLVLCRKTKEVDNRRAENENRIISDFKLEG